MKIVVPRGRRTFFFAALIGVALVGNSWLMQSWAQNPSSPISVPAAAPGTNSASGADQPAGDDNIGIANKSLLGIIRDGGFVMYPLFLCSFVLLVFTFERAISLRTGRVIPGPFVKRFIHQLQEGQLDRDEARLVCEENGSSVA